MRKFFGTDGVRGKANIELTPELAFKLGRAGGYVLTKHRKEEHSRPKVLVGRDTRASGPMLQHALISGLLSVGVEVLDLDVISTPAVSFLTKTQDADAGIMISASHNPTEDNGIKFFGHDGYKLSDQTENEIEQVIKEDNDLPRPSAEGLGSVVAYPEGALKYTEFLTQTVPDDDLSGIKVVVDGANGATSGLINNVFADLNIDFSMIATSPDGLNINDGVGSTHPELLQEEVLKQQADLGLAFDGDGDRLIAVDEKGEIVDGDHIMFILAKDMNKAGKLKQDTVVTTTMSNIGLYKALENNGMKSVQTNVGDRYVVEEMVKSGYNIGGEQSGHIILFDINNTGDGMLTGIQLLNIIKKSGKSLSELTEDIESYPQTLVNVPVNDKNNFESYPEIMNAIDLATRKLNGEGRILVRPSGTENLLRVMAEAKTKELADEYVANIVEVVQKAMGAN